MKQLIIVIGFFLLILLGRNVFAAEAVCSRGDILICDDFEGWSLTGGQTTIPPVNTNFFVASATDWASNNWILGEQLSNFVNNNVYRRSFTPVGTPSFGANGSATAYQIYIRAANPGDTQYPNHRFTTQPVGQEIYARLYLKFSSSYFFNYFSECCFQKIAYIRNENNTSLARVELGMATRNTKWDTFTYTTTTCPASGSIDLTKGRIALDTNVHQEEYFQTNFFNENTAACSAVTTDPRPNVYFDRDTWYSVEFMVKQNTLGVANGALALWVDGRKIIDRPTGVTLVSTAGLLFNDLWISAYSGDLTLPADQALWYDNLVVSTHYIGPIGGTGAPLPPAQVQGVTVTP